MSAGIAVTMLARLLRARSRPADSAAPSNDPIESAWKIHAAVVDWTGKVDGKASFALALEAAAITVIIGSSGRGGVLAPAGPIASTALYWLGLILLGGAVFAAAIVVTPRLRAKHTAADAASDYVYFGHARLWSAPQLATALEGGELLPVLTRNIVTMSRIAWRKHQLVQVSVWTFAAGAASTTASGLIDALSG